MAALVGGSGVGAAKSGSTDRSEGGITVTDGRFVVNRGDMTPSQYEFWNGVVEDFNAALDAGHMSLQEPDARTTATGSDQPTVQLNSSASEMVGDEVDVDLGSPSPSDAGTMRCNKTGSDIDRNLWGTNVDLTLFLDDGTCTDLSGLVGAGSGAAAAYAALVDAGVISASALGGPATAFVGGIIVAYMGWITIENDGCGVVVETRFNPLTPIAPITATPLVSSQ